VSNTDKSDVRDAFDHIPRQMDNPYKKMKHWIKDEIIDFHSLVEAISQRELIESWKSKAENKKRSCQSTLDKLNAGKKTLKTLFKSASSKANEITNLTQTIAQCSVDIENLEKAIVYVET
jgi:predicted RNase H-like nuclease (RuvC/YqgF family)